MAHLHPPVRVAQQCDGMLPGQLVHQGLVHGRACLVRQILQGPHGAEPHFRICAVCLLHQQVNAPMLQGQLLQGGHKA